jgi:hypothetical protein
MGLIAFVCVLAALQDGKRGTADELVAEPEIVW